MEGELRQLRPKQRNSKQKNPETRISYESSLANLSEEGKRTVRLVNASRKPLNRFPQNLCAVFDRTYPDYIWLSAGWIVEERLTPNNRLYRYYYDPMGRFYDTRSDVEKQCENMQRDRVSIIME